MSGWTPRLIGIAILMVITGTINTLATKWADQGRATGRDGGKPRSFDHPFVQACGMFLGEFSCLVAFLISYWTVWRNKHDDVEVVQNTKYNVFLLWPAALCDMTGTSLMYVGLNMTNASSFQMLRGSIIIFTALLSVAFIRPAPRIYPFKWVAMFTVLVGLVVVGLADMLFNNTESSSGCSNGTLEITGDMLIIMAQVVVAFQMVYEQTVLVKHNIHPLAAVGLEGMFGFLTLGALTIPMCFIYAGDTFGTGPDLTLEDWVDAIYQLGGDYRILVGTLGSIISIAFFNFAGISVSKYINATTRMVLDSLRTLFIWIVSLALGWQAFTVESFLLQALGFGFLVLGMALFYEIGIGPFLEKRGVMFFVTPIEDRAESDRKDYERMPDEADERSADKV